MHTLALVYLFLKYANTIKFIYMKYFTYNIGHKI